MPAIPLELNKHLRNTLVRCVPFDNYQELRALFTDTRIAPWCDLILDTATTRDERVYALIDALRDQANATGDNALILFLHTLADNTPAHNPLQNWYRTINPVFCGIT